MGREGEVRMELVVVKVDRKGELAPPISERTNECWPPELTLR